MEFFVLPDHAAAPPLVPVLVRRPEPHRVLCHESGRPWLVGEWTDEEIVYAEHGGRRLALLGRADTDTARLTAILRGVTTLTDLTRIARRIAGSHHLIASFAGRVRAQGTLSTVRQIHHARVEGVTVAADRAYGLALATGRAVDTVTLALRMMTPLPPWPLTERCSWLDVAQTPPGTYLALEPTGSAHPVRWWRPPPAEIALAEGAGRVGAAIHAAVATRAHGGGALSADLSGGMDSTGLCFATAKAGGTGTSLITTHLASADPGNDDRRWADLAAGLLPGARHHVLHRPDLPSWFDPGADAGPGLDAPFVWVRARTRTAHLARAYAALGSTRHLVGHGGDELFDVAPSYLHTLARTRPLDALRHARAHRALYRWRLGPTVRALADRTSFADSLLAIGDGLTATLSPADPATVLGWGTGARLPGWATPAAVDAARARFRAAAVQSAPLSPVRVHHQTLDLVRQIGEVLRQVDVFTRAHGIAWEAPYLDDHVIDAAMSIRLADRAAPRAYKPVLVAALRDTVPDSVLGRVSKAEFSAEAYAGLRRHRRALLDLSEDMLMARAGLVDADAFRRALLSPHPTAQTMIPFDATLACESWLRSVAAAAPAALSTGGPR